MTDTATSKRRGKPAANLTPAACSFRFDDARAHVGMGLPKPFSSSKSFREHDMQCGRARNVFGAFVSEPQKVDSSEEVLTVAQDHRRNRNM